MKAEDMSDSEILDAIVDVLYQHGIVTPDRENYHELPDIIDGHLKGVEQQLKKNEAMANAAWRKNTHTGY